MSNWDNLAANQWVDRAALQQAVDEGFFTVNQGVPATEPTKLVNSGDARNYVNLDTTKLPTNLNEWVTKQELAGTFPVVVTDFKDLASPRQSVYNPVNKMVYFIDYDNNTAGLWYFDPVTAKTPADFVSVPGTNAPGQQDNSMRFISMAYDQTRNKIYVQGENSSGLLIIDCATNTVTNTVTYGTNGRFKRQNVVIVGNNVWAYDLVALAWQVISMDTETIIGQFVLADIPSGSGYSSSFIAIINNLMWVLLTSSTSPSMIAVYNITAGIPDYTTDLVHSITGIGSALSYDGKIEVAPIYGDEAKSTVYAPATGDSTIFTFDSVTYASKTSIAIPLEGKSFASMNMQFRSTTGQLYATGVLVDSSGGNQISRTYNIDRDNQTILNTLDGVSYGNFAYVPDVDLSYVCEEFLTFYSVPNTGYLTDGVIQALN